MIRQTNESLSSMFADGESVITVPGENYPDKVDVVRLPGGGVEPCCGTHVLSTGDVQSFAVVEVKNNAYGVKSFR